MIIFTLLNFKPFFDSSHVCDDAQIYSFYFIVWVSVGSYRVVVVQEFGELGHGACGQLGVILVVDEVDDSGLEQLRGLGQLLHVGHVAAVHLRGQDGRALRHRLGEHGRTHALRSCHGVLGIQVCRGKREFLIWTFKSLDLHFYES